MPSQDIPLNIPKKTKLYVEQTQREREQAIDMHRIFQRDLCKLRLSTARAYVRVLTDGQVGMGYGRCMASCCGRRTRSSTCSVAGADKCTLNGATIACRVGRWIAP